MFPTHWTRSSIGELCEMIKGDSQIVRTKPGPYPLVTTGEERKTADCYQFDRAAVCVPMISAFGHGKAGLKRVQYQEGKFALANILTALLVNDISKLTPRFLHLFLDYHKDQLIVPLQTGVANMALTIAKLATVPVAFPPLDEQRRIVSILDEAESLRQLRARADERMAEFIPALFNQMFGDPATNPKGWNSVTLGQVLSFITSGSRGWAQYYAPGGAQFIRVQNLTGHRLSFDNVAHVKPPDTAETKRTRIMPHDLLLAITGATIGLSALAPEDCGEAYVNQHVAILRLNDDVDPVYAAAFMADSRGGQRQVAKMQYGHTKPGIGLEQIRSMTMPLPPLSQQREFAARVAEARALQDQQARSRARLETGFQALLYKAFQGEL